MVRVGNNTKWNKELRAKRKRSLRRNRDCARIKKCYVSLFDFLCNVK